MINGLDTAALGLSDLRSLWVVLGGTCSVQWQLPHPHPPHHHYPFTPPFPPPYLLLPPLTFGLVLQDPVVFSGSSHPRRALNHHHHLRTQPPPLCCATPFLYPRLSLVPQDPVVFSGSFRSNLDPFGSAGGDGAIWGALKQAGLDGMVSSMGVSHVATREGGGQGPMGGGGGMFVGGGGVGGSIWGALRQAGLDSMVSSMGVSLSRRGEGGPGAHVCVWGGGVTAWQGMKLFLPDGLTASLTYQLAAYTNSVCCISRRVVNTVPCMVCCAVLCPAGTRCSHTGGWRQPKWWAEAAPVYGEPHC